MEYLVKLYELGKLSSGKAAKLAGMDKVTFLKTLGKYQISIEAFIPDAVKQELLDK